MEILRIEIAIENGEVLGAQMTVLVNGQQQVRGLNTGNQPEYSDVLNDVLGEALTTALATIGTLQDRITELEMNGLNE